MCDKEEGKEMNLTSERIDVKHSLSEAMKEVKEIREGKRPRRSWKNMVARVRDNLEK